MQFNVDELSILISTFAVVYGIPRAMGRHGGFRQCLRSFLENGNPAEPMILFLLVIPEFMLAVYYALLIVSPEFRANVDLRTLVVRPSIFTSNVILAVYFLDGRLVRWIRWTVAQFILLWNRLPIYRI